MKIWVGLVGLVVVVGAIVAFVLVYRPAIDPISPPLRTAFNQDMITKGQSLAEIGDCAVCHTPANGPAYSGGLPVPTPFGTIYSTNITPDADTGIGRWSLAAFSRAMSDGVSRDGHLLYPAFPYDHFTHVDSDDVQALYAFLMTRQPVSSTAPPNGLGFPFNIRMMMAGWDLLFLHHGAAAPDPLQSSDWNRGRYLVDGLGHCSACHTPRNLLGAEQSGAAFAGGDAENWLAPALNANGTAPEPWTVESMTAYLRRGWVDSHSASAGPMQLVYHNLGDVAEDDARAIATYLVAQAGPPTSDHLKRAADATLLAKQTTLPNPDAPGASVFQGACNNCHRNGGPTLAGHLPLALYTAVNSPDPRNLIHVILDGVHPIEGEAGPIMPGFAASLTDDQITSLATYIRSGFSKEPAWTNVDTTVHDIRQGKV